MRNIFFVIKKIIIEILLFLFWVIRFLKPFLAAVFLVLLKPVMFLARRILFGIFIKIYLGYFSLLKKTGLDRWKGNIPFFVFNRRAIHVLVLFLVLAISTRSVLFNAGIVKALSENAEKTIVSELMTREFYEEDDDGLIEEYFTDQSMLMAQSKYLNDSLEYNGIDYDLAEEDDLSGTEEYDILIKPDLATTKISKKSRSGEIEYIVQSGDSISTIASDFDISVNTVLWANDLTARSLIRPGDRLIILPDTGINHEVAKGDTLGAISSKYDVDMEDILAANDLLGNATLTVGQKLFIPDGKPYSAPVSTVKTVVYNPITVIKDLINPSAKSTPSNKMFWPAQGTITQYFTWRHHGLDIANKQGTPIYAADAGTVIDAGWSTSGYGNKIDIDHGGGKVTRYGHFYKLSVSKGDKVERGQIIGLMGTTGNSTGPHLHFEVRINNITYNPLDYIK